MLGRKDRDSRDAFLDNRDEYMNQDVGKEEKRMLDDKDFGGVGKDLNAFIGKGSEFSGKLTFEGTVRIDGKVDGEVFSRGMLIIGPGADIKAKVNVDSVMISGRITGDVAASKQIEMRAPGKLYGNIKTPTLIIEKGVIFEGHCKMENIEKDEHQLRAQQPPPRPDARPIPKPPENIKE